MLRVKVTPICLLVAMVGAMTDINTVTDGPIHTTELNIPTGPKIYYLHIKSDIRFRFATTVVTSKLVNPDTRAHQTTFEVTLPNEAFITNFTLSVRNQTYAGEVKTKEAARQEYESAVTQGRTAAHISVRPRETNKFNIDVNVAAEEKLTFELRYQELLQRKLGAYNHVIYVKPGEPVSDLRVDVDIFESRAINNLKVPPIRNDLLTNIDITSTNDLAVIEHISDRNVHIRYQPNMEQQTSDGIDGQFTVSYDVERQTDGGDILMVNGYFVHFFAPSGLEPRPKDIVFILDKSGSMRGTKFQQLKEAMLTILSQIDPVDKFNIITFDSSITRWRDDHLVPASESAIQQAKKYVNNLRAVGGTNIQAAMLDGISQLELRTDRSRSAVIIFLTDGEATTGETTPKRILSRVAERNEDRVPVFSLAFGRNADFNLVKRMAVQNNGFGRKVYEDSDASLQISNFYTEVSTVLLKNVTFNYLNGTVVPDTLICDLSGLLKLGSELVVSGRLSSEEVVDLQPHITGIGSNGLVNLIVPDTAITTQLDITQDSDIIAITEKLWAYLTIKQWTRQMEAATNKEAAEDWRRNITEMALKYHFVTPMTSMVVTLPDELKVSPIKVEEDEIPVEEDDSMQPPIMTAKYNSGGRSGMTPLSGGGGMVGPSLMHARTFTQTSGSIPLQRSRTSYDTYYTSRKRQGSRQPLKKKFWQEETPTNSHDHIKTFHHTNIPTNDHGSSTRNNPSDVNKCPNYHVSSKWTFNHRNRPAYYQGTYQQENDSD
ncbi:inter-alpha-trypsin inhibitor heavy chain H3-like isoform X2 [Pecten maximus]|uniref:inter-alpha-trypsin inhibitor heavy chain H3-like isoform X2 n=1 Tax=Pecten maximus TaxID=6579 RepID=UPI001458C987|nr:inter-alpha-trypsin inhibitor heavy chain H3-like isoform X2 [Pecten maximus]